MWSDFNSLIIIFVTLLEAVLEIERNKFYTNSIVYKVCASQEVKAVSYGIYASSK